MWDEITWWVANLREKVYYHFNKKAILRKQALEEEKEEFEKEMAKRVALSETQTFLRELEQVGRLVSIEEYQEKYLVPRLTKVTKPGLGEDYLSWVTYFRTREDFPHILELTESFTGTIPKKFLLSNHPGVMIICKYPQFIDFDSLVSTDFKSPFYLLVQGQEMWCFASSRYSVYFSTLKNWPLCLSVPLEG